MKAFACLVRQTPQEWILSIGDELPVALSVADTKPSELARAVLEYLRRAQSKFGDCQDHIVFCPESRSVLFAVSPIPPSLKTQDRQQLKYHAESLLPLDAEQMAADFVINRKEFRVMAMDRREWQPMIDAFTAVGLHFRWIAPASVLALEEWKRSSNDPARVVVWEDGDACDLWQLDASGIVRWTHLSGDASDRLVGLRLFASQAAGARVWTAIHCSDATLDQLGQVDGIEVRAITGKPQAAWTASAADRLCRTTDEAWFDLRDGSLAGYDRLRALRGWMQIAAAAVVGLLLLTSLACYWKAGQAQRQQAAIEDAHRQLYKATFPENGTTTGVSEVFVSEYRNLLGETNDSGELESIPSALPLLVATLQALSVDENIRVQTRNLSIQSGQLTIELSFETESDAKALVKHLSDVGIDTGKYRMERRSDGKPFAKFTGSLKARTVLE